MVSLSYEDVLNCCASKTFAQRLASCSPFQDDEEVFTKSRDIWWNEVCHRVPIAVLRVSCEKPLCGAVVYF